MSTATLHNDDKKNRATALIATIAVHAALLLFFFWYVIITPLPPYKIIPAPQLEVEADFGNNIEGTGHVERENKGENLSDNKTNNVKQAASKQSASPVLSNDAEEASIKTPKNTTKTNKVDTATAVKPQVSIALASALNKFRHSKGQAPGGDGNSGNAGNAGTPNGTKPGEGNGTGKGFNFFLRGRKLVLPPHINDNSQDEGRVVVRILVDQSGKVIKAVPGEKGSNTTSAVLYAKAKEAALSTKFNVSPDGTPEQQGTMTFIFVVQ